MDTCILTHAGPSTQAYTQQPIANINNAILLLRNATKMNNFS